MKNYKIEKTKIKSISREIEKKFSSHFYDISILDKESRNFFANDILVHNSCYFSIHPIIQNIDFSPNKENIVDLYDLVVEEMNKSWVPALKKYFNVKPEKMVIRAGRELVGSSGLFITKKRYAILIYDKEGVRLDINGSPGKLKAMGLDLKRSDTPEKIQDFLESVLIEVLRGASYEDITKMIEKFKEEELSKWNPWLKGTPKRVNNLTLYSLKEETKNNTNLLGKLYSKLASAKTEKEKEKIRKEIEKIRRVTIPGHVAASLNWNKMLKVQNDKFSMQIQDGSKIIVCKLKPNGFNMNSIAYPIDQEHNLPEWFKKLPFDEKEMEEVCFYSKLKNLLQVLGWDIERFKRDSTEELFSFN